MKTSLARRSLVGLGLLLTIVLLSGFWPNIPDVDKGTPLAAISPPPSHVVWEEHPVGGLILCQPPDSAGKSQCIKLPPGSILAIPHLVEGEDPDSRRSES